MTTAKQRVHRRQRRFLPEGLNITIELGNLRFVPLLSFGKADKICGMINVTPRTIDRWRGQVRSTASFGNAHGAQTQPFLNRSYMMKNETTFVEIHAVEHAWKRRHLPTQRGWRIPVDYIGKGVRHPGHVEIVTQERVLTPRFMEVAKAACCRERGKKFVIGISGEGRAAALYARQE